MIPESMRCLLIDRSPSEAHHPTQADSITAQVVQVNSERLPAGDVTIQVVYSSLNYKDALAYQGHRGVIKQLPHVPGIDAAGVVVESSVEQWTVGQEVIVTGYELGQSHWGGWSELIRVPAGWVVPLPAGLTLRQAMVYGTAGFTAAQSIMALQRNDVQPGSGPVVVTGATGGVGSMAVRMLAHLGYEVVAVSGKSAQFEKLLELGAHHALTRQAVIDVSSRPLLSARWAGAVDTVGGTMLENLLRATRYGGCVTACGLVAGADLSMTVYPFLLRGVSLCGIASADCPYGKRQSIWELLAGAWRPDSLEQWVLEVDLKGLPTAVEQILHGQVVGRVVVKV
jgi:acrylyl-CoA reductase (NADPH)